MRDSTAKLIAEHEAKIAVMKQEDGFTEFQYRELDTNLWRMCDGNGVNPSWCFGVSEYRVKLQPTEVWVWLHDSGHIGSTTWASAESCAHHQKDGRAVLFREVTND
jgi:hypothetical protein